MMWALVSSRKITAVISTVKIGMLMPKNIVSSLMS